jgi:hypothetical protein
MKSITSKINSWDSLHLWPTQFKLQQPLIIKGPILIKLSNVGYVSINKINKDKNKYSHHVSVQEVLNIYINYVLFHGWIKCYSKKRPNKKLKWSYKETNAKYAK